MPRLPFARSSHKKTASGGGDAGDDLTVGSFRSLGEKSVSDRIMGRMKMNLSSLLPPSLLGGGFGGGGGGFGDNDNGSSLGNCSECDDLDDGASAPARGVRRRRPGRGASVGARAGGGVVGGGAVAGGASSTRSAGSATRGSTGEEGRRTNRRPRRWDDGGGGASPAVDDDAPPVEYSLDELRSMTEDELRVVMRYAGVSSGEGGVVTPPNDDDAGGEGAGSSSDVRRRNSLVKIFVESGRVKLVPRGGTTATASASASAPASERRPGGATAKGRRMRTTPKKEAATAPPPSSSSRTSEDVGEDDGGEGSPMRRASSSASPAATNVVAGGNQKKQRPSMNASENSLMARMSKLEKIAELKTENASVKTENKSLKKTVKKLLGQLTDAIAEKNELLLLPSRQPQEQEQRQQQHQPEQQQQQQQQQQQPMTSSVDGIPSTHGDDAHIKTQTPLSPIEELRGDSKIEGDASRISRDGEKGGEDDVVVVVAAAAVCPFPIPSPDDDVDTSARSGSISSRLSEVLVSVESSEKLTSSSSSSSKENITLLMQKLKKEKQAHENTEFRLKVRSLRVRRIAGSHVVSPYRDPRLIALLFFDRPSSLAPAATNKKAELDILTNEVKGLQRELGLALRSLDDAKERARESRESTHCLRRELRDAKASLKESSAEAEARDRLIETFKGILLQKVGLPQ
jgi:hypothetical protein